MGQNLTELPSLGKNWCLGVLGDLLFPELKLLGLYRLSFKIRGLKLTVTPSEATSKKENAAFNEGSGEEVPSETHQGCPSGVVLNVDFECFFTGMPEVFMV
jgi:hypothetical protein